MNFEVKVINERYQGNINLERLQQNILKFQIIKAIQHCNLNGFSREKF